MILKSNFKLLIKRYGFLYHVYFKVMSFLINIIKLFIKTDDHLILFVSFGGRRYSDSPRAIYEYMCHDIRFRDYKLVWGFINPDGFPRIIEKVELDTFKYYITSLRARCWVTNVQIERGLDYKGKNTFYLYTGHGSPIKKCGIDANNQNTFKSFARRSADASLAQSEFERLIRGRTRKEVFLTGTPSNDILVNCDDNYRRIIRKELGIGDSKIAILYAPTFREYRHLGATDMPDVDFYKWHQILGEDFIILYRAHPASKVTLINDGSWFIDVSSREDIEPIMIASDLLISDYSGLITDYSIMHKPIYLWVYDYEKYEKTRGLYFDVRKVLPYAEREEILLSMIKKGYSKEQIDMLYSFQQEFATVYGSATQNAVNLIYEKIAK